MQRIQRLHSVVDSAARKRVVSGVEMYNVTSGALRGGREGGGEARKKGKIVELEVERKER